MTNFDLRNQQVETQYNAGRDIAIYQQIVPITLTIAQQKRNRVAMLERVRSYWIKGVLENSFSETGSIALSLLERSDIVDDPLRHVAQDVERATRALPAGTSMLDAYTEADEELLILGESGSGKTTLLLELTRDLLERATHDETHPIPVVFNLSSWTQARQSLGQWLIEELARNYLVPRKLGASWVANEQVLPLLDGLDEVSSAHREECIQAINVYHREHGLVPLVVTSRSADYLSQVIPLQLHSAVVVQPLTLSQVDEYLTHKGEHVQAMRLMLHNDSVLQELITTPLLLNILALTYQDKTITDIATDDGTGSVHRRIFADYVQYMLQRKATRTSYSSQQTLSCLSWLARQLSQRGQSEFFLERMQPGWLTDTKKQNIYEWLGVAFPAVLIGAVISPVMWLAVSSIKDNGIVHSLYFILVLGCIGGLIGGLFSKERLTVRLSEKAQIQRNVVRSLVPALSIAVLIGLVATLLYMLTFNLSLSQALFEGSALGLGSLLLALLALSGFIGGVHITDLQTEMVTEPPGVLQTPLGRAEHLKNGLVVGVIYGVTFWLGDSLSPAGNFPALGGLVYGLILGISGTVLSILLVGRKRTIQPMEVVVWSWGNFRRCLINVRNLGIGVIVGTLSGLICGLGAGLRAGPVNPLAQGLQYAVSDGISIGLSYWFLVGIFQGISGVALDKQRRIMPNQGIHLSACNGMILGCIGACLGGVLGFLAVVLRDPFFDLGNGTDVSDALLAALIIAIAGALVVGLLNGGIAWLRHYVLRFLLWRAKHIPWNYPRFLDEAAAHILLRKVGGSYLFIHRLLLDYFASIEDTSTFS